MDNFKEQFKSWVDQQPANTYINHSSWHWCAIGGFAKEFDQPTGAVIMDFKYAYGHDAYMMLGNGGWYQNNTVDISTYGKLSKWLDQLNKQGVV